MPVVLRGVDHTDYLEAVARLAAVQEAMVCLSVGDVARIRNAIVIPPFPRRVPSMAMVACIIGSVALVLSLVALFAVGCASQSSLSDPETGQLSEITPKQVEDIDAWMLSARIAPMPEVARMFRVAGVERMRSAIPKAIVYGARENDDEARREARRFLSTWTEAEIQQAAQDYVSDEFPMLLMVWKRIGEAH